MYIFIYNCKCWISQVQVSRNLNEVTRLLYVVEFKVWTSFFIFTCNIWFFVPYFFPPFKFFFFFFSFSLQVWGFAILQNKLPTLSTNTGSYLPCMFKCIHNSWFCVWLCFCICVHLCMCMCQLYTSMYMLVGSVSVCEPRLASMGFSTSSFQILMPMQFCNNLLVSHHSFFHAVCLVVLLGEPHLVVCKSNF